MISDVEQLKEELKTKESALLRLETEKLELSERIQESHEEMESVAKERDDLQRLQALLQSKNDQLTENMEEIRAKVGCILFPTYVWFSFKYFVSKNFCRN